PLALEVGTLLDPCAALHGKIAAPDLNVEVVEGDRELTGLLGGADGGDRPGKVTRCDCSALRVLECEAAAFEGEYMTARREELHGTLRSPLLGRIAIFTWRKAVLIGRR